MVEPVETLIDSMNCRTATLPRLASRGEGIIPEHTELTNLLSKRVESSWHGKKRNEQSTNKNGNNASFNSRSGVGASLDENCGKW